MLGIDDLVSDIKRGRVKSVITYGHSLLPKPLPCVVIVENNGDNDNFAWQLWVCFPIGQDKELRKYFFKELPLLLAQRKDRYCKKVWRHGNNFDSAVTIQEGSQNFLRCGIVITIPKILRFQSSDIT